MIGLGAAFWLMVAFFGLIGALRGWTREVIAMSGLVLSLFALNYFGAFWVSLLGATVDANVDPFANLDVRRQQFYILAITHLVIAFFSYQGPTWAGRVHDRLRIRDSLQDKVLGVLVGSVNGYLIMGTLWAFLEYQVRVDGYIPLPVGIAYPFDPTVLVRPGVDSELISLIGNLPLPLLAPYLPFLIVVVFLFVIVVMI